MGVRHPRGEDQAGMSARTRSSVAHARERDAVHPAISIAALVERARAAQRICETYDQTRIDELVTAAGWAIVNPEHNQRLAEVAVRDSGLGNVADKIAKNRRKTI